MPKHAVFTVSKYFTALPLRAWRFRLFIYFDCPSFNGRLLPDKPVRGASRIDRTPNVRYEMQNHKPILMLVLSCCCFQFSAADEPGKNVRVGIIGLDTSHVTAFTKLLNADNPKPEFAHCRVVAAYPQGSADIESSVSRVPKYTEQIKEMGVTIVDSIEELVGQVDVVLLESNDGRVHLEQILPALKAGKRTFVDKPMAASLVDVIAIFEAAQLFGTPVFSSSSLRYGQGTLAAVRGEIGDVVGCDTRCSCSLEPTHPDFFWYGIHGVESLFAVMGTGCQQVVRMHSAGSDMAVGMWEGGRIGSYRGIRDGKPEYSGTAIGTEKILPVGQYDGYAPLVVEIVKFFKGGDVPVSEAETIEIFAFMEAADESKRQGGVPIAIGPLIDAAREEAAKKATWK